MILGLTGLMLLLIALLSCQFHTNVVFGEIITKCTSSLSTSTRVRSNHHHLVIYNMRNRRTWSFSSCKRASEVLHCCYWL